MTIVIKFVYLTEKIKIRKYIYSFGFYEKLFQDIIITHIKNAPQNVRTRYEANCKSINKTPDDSDVISVPQGLDN
ncbi:hypothetical protein AXF41_15440 [Clostridium haemolyticum]|uniref:hypothetical protein n=1 Tax=Clostridium haemolyticum TaxID=84025 RepID=UPI0009C7ACAC|nr:hypothetical protein [Clostridium haemolyticum]OOB74896.1 hypothetical protein AXF41_15440 [Clostridium haemolyticum]